MANTSFSSGMLAGAGLSSAIDRREALAQQARAQKRAEVTGAVQDTLAQVAELSKQAAAKLYSGDITDPAELENVKATHGSGVLSMFKSLDQLTEYGVAEGVLTPDEAALAKKQLNLSARPVDPRPAQNLEARGAGVEEQAKVTGKETAIASPVAQGNREADLQRAIRLKSTPTTSTQKITTKDITPSTKTSIEKTLLTTGDAINRLRNIRNSVKEDYFKLWTRAGFKLDKIKSILGDKPSPKDAEAMKAFQEFQSETFENFNLYVKSITGAAMSNQEAQRIEKAMPVSGEGVWPKQSYEQFVASLSRVERMLADTQIRYKVMIDKGLATGDVEADKAAGVGDAAEAFMSHAEARRIYAQRGDAIYDEMLAEYGDEKAAKAATIIALKREFGL